MKKLLNTMYVTSSNRYLSLDGENVVVLEKDKMIGRVPLHNLEGIVTFGYTGVSPALMGACAERDISLCFLKPNGNFLARVNGKVRGNVVLRKEQYQLSEDKMFSLKLAINCILGKVYNSRWILERAIRDHELQIDTAKVKKASLYLKDALGKIANADNMEELRGREGEAASIYFSVFNELIIQQKEQFSFSVRNRRPPLDNVNALLSFCYTLLTNQMASALETVGLDPYVGFMHTDRPGRVSLALDMIEELRPVVADRFVLTLINKRMISDKHFAKKEDGAILLNDEGRGIVLKEWQERKQSQIKHPFIDEKIEWGIVSHTQAMLLARYIRGDLDEYPPFFWK